MKNMKNIVVSDAAHQALKIKAALDGKTMKEAAEEAIANATGFAAGAEGDEQKDKKKEDGKNK